MTVLSTKNIDYSGYATLPPNILVTDPRLLSAYDEHQERALYLSQAARVAQEIYKRVRLSEDTD